MLRRLGILSIVFLFLLVAGASSTGNAPSSASAAHFDSITSPSEPLQNIYNDSYRGWPVSPTSQQPPIRSVFLDPRPLAESVTDDAGPGGAKGDKTKTVIEVHNGVYHLGVDFSVRDDQPESGATGDHTHRVYAIEGGIVKIAPYAQGANCGSKSIRIHDFGYGHVDGVGVVTNGQQIKAGQMIGWTCRGHWHMHLTEFTTIAGVEVQINPLRPNGKLGRFYDSLPPKVENVSFYPPENPDWHTENHALVSNTHLQALDPLSLSGIVDLRAEINDPQSNIGWLKGSLSRLYTDQSPYSAQVMISKGGRPVMNYETFRGDTYLATSVPGYDQATSFSDHYAPGTHQALPAWVCLKLKSLPSCGGTYWFRMFAGFNSSASPYWDTTSLPNGSYTVKVSAFDMSGNEGSESISIKIAN